MVFGTFLMLTSWQDLKSRQIDLWIFMVFGAAAVVIWWNPGNWFGIVSWLECLAGGLFGLAFLWFGRKTGERIGVGDGLFFLVSGIMLGLRRCLILFGGAVWLCGIYSLFYVLYGRLKNQLHVGKEKLPFLPFAAAAGILLMLGEWSA